MRILKLFSGIIYFRAFGYFSFLISYFRLNHIPFTVKESRYTFFTFPSKQWLTALIKKAWINFISKVSASNKMLLKISRHTEENTCAGVFLYYIAGRKLFTCEICNIFKNIFFHRTHPVAARNYFDFQVIKWPRV